MDGSQSNSSPEDSDADPFPLSSQAHIHGSGQLSPTNPAAKKEKGRVRFNSNAAATQPTPGPSHVPTLPSVPAHREAPIQMPRPSLLRGNSAGSVTGAEEHDEHLDPAPDSEKALSAALAQARARQVAANVKLAAKRDSPPGSRMSMESNAETVYSDGELIPSERGIPLQNLSGNEHSAHDKDQAQEAHHQALKEEAYHLVRSHTQRFVEKKDHPQPEHTHEEHAPLTEINDGNYDGVYAVPPPQHYRGSVLSQLLKLYKPPEVSQGHNRQSSASSIGGFSTPGSGSGSVTPTRRKWYEQNRSQETLANLVEASARLANPNTHDPKGNGKKRPPMHKRTGSNSRLSRMWEREEVRITVHIAETLSRQEYIIKLCRALMLFGAPTHRLEEYLKMTARVLEIDGQFLYLPGCMIISFDDKSTHTTEVRICRSAQGIDLGKLKDVHLVYKEVMHDVIGVDEGTEKLDKIMDAKDKFPVWLRVLVFGLTSVTAAPFSFKARLIDLPLLFCFGCLVGILQLIVAPRSSLYNNVFEVSATVLVSFLARAFGSIRGGSLFCFSALAQGGIVMLLPGYLVLCSALELQSRAIVPGSIRIVYACIYCLFLGFGIMVGAALYGLFDSNATSETTCSNPISSEVTFAFVPLFVICISILYQAKWRQMPVMVIVAFTGYIVNYYSSLKFVASPQIASTLGALCVGVLANLYSRVRHGVAAATLIPAIFTQVPGGLASTGGLLSGLKTANELTNSTQTVNGTSSVSLSTDESLNTVVFDVAASMIQIAIGIAVGLFLSALLIYPLGKRRSGLFSF